MFNCASALTVGVNFYWIIGQNWAHKMPSYPNGRWLQSQKILKCYITSRFSLREANEEHSDINDIRLHVVTIEMVPTAALAINRSFMCSPPCSKAHLSCFGYSLWLHLLLFFRNIDVTVLMNREYCPKFQSDPKPLKIRQTNTRLLAVLIYRFFL